MITVFVFVMILLVDFIDTASKKRMMEIMQGGLWRQDLHGMLPLFSYSVKDSILNVLKEDCDGVASVFLNTKGNTV